MKAFEEWWLKRCKKQFGFEGSMESKGFEMDSEIWKAALEWALEKGKYGNCGMCYTESIIEQELEE